MREEHQKHSEAEGLFVCAQSANHNSVLLLDPFSGSSRWVLRGFEFQQGILQTAEPIGNHPSFLCVALADKPILHIIPLTRLPKKGGAPSPSSHCAPVKSMLAHKVRFIQTHPCGDFIFVAAENKLFTWEIHSGQLLSLVEGHLRDISAMRISSCGHFLVSASLDGDVKVFMTAKLIAEHENGLCSANVSAFAIFSPHSLPVTDLFLSGGAQLRILSVSADHSATLYSLSTQQILLRITVDRPLTACCLDPAELRIFLAAESGPICSVDICTQFLDQFVPFSSHNSSISSSIRRFCNQHNASVSKLTVSADGARMASGDEKGSYCVWDTTNGQCLLSGTMPGPISALSFRRHWTTIDDLSKSDNVRRQLTPVTTLQRNLSAKRSLKMIRRHWIEEANGTNEETAQKNGNGLLSALVKRINSGEQILASWFCAPDEKLTTSKNDGKKRRISKTKSPPGKMLPLKGTTNEALVCPVRDNEVMSKRELMLAEQVRRLQRELARVVQLNAELYNYSTNMALEDSSTENARSNS